MQEQFGGSPDKLADAMAGLRAYQQAARTPQPASTASESREIGPCRLRHYPAHGAPQKSPVLVVPSLINGQEILDLAEHRSLLRWLAEQGFDCWLLDWGEVTASRQHEDIDLHIQNYLVPALQSFAEPVHLVGYCLGGTIAMAAANLHPVRSITAIATPWHFSAYPDERKREVAALWQHQRSFCEEMGLAPLELLQTGFWSLDPERVARKFADLANEPPDSEKFKLFVATEDWTNGGQPLPFAAAAQLFERLYRDDESGLGNWTIAGRTISPDGIDAPSLVIRSHGDLIVPAATSPELGARIDISAGHVGMMIGSRREEQLWQPLADFLATADRGW